MEYKYSSRNHDEKSPVDRHFSAYNYTVKVALWALTELVTTERVFLDSLSRHFNAIWLA